MVAGSPLPWKKGEERVKERGIGVRAISCALDSGRPPGDCVDQLGETAGMTPSGVIHRPITGARRDQARPAAAAAYCDNTNLLHSTITTLLYLALIVPPRCTRHSNGHAESS